MLKVNKENFRSICEEYLNFIFSITTKRKQVSPFIVIDNNEVTAVYYTGELLKFPKESLIFHAWPGKYSMNIFCYKLEEIESKIIEKQFSKK